MISKKYSRLHGKFVNVWDTHRNGWGQGELLHKGLVGVIDFVFFYCKPWT